MATRWMSGWGIKFLDYDNDGDFDLFLVNGFPEPGRRLFKPGEISGAAFTVQKTGDKYKNVSSQSGPVFGKSFSARGMAVGDFNNDGGIDVLVAINDGAPILLRNNVGKQNHWLGVQLVGDKIQSRCGRRTAYLQVGGPYANSHENWRWKLSLVARSAGVAGRRQANEDRLSGCAMATARRQRGTFHEFACRQVHHDCGRNREVEVTSQFAQGVGNGRGLVRGPRRDGLPDDFAGSGADAVVRRRFFRGRASYYRRQLPD